MKLVGIVVLVFWLVSGFAGGWMLEGEDMRVKTVARGPMSLVKAINENPVSIPGTAD